MSDEQPAGDAPSVKDAGLSYIEIKRLEFLRWLVASGIVNEEGYRILPGGYVLYTGDYSA